MLPVSANPTECEDRLLEHAARWPTHASLADLTGRALREIAAREGIDFATALLYDRLRNSREHGPFIKRVESLGETRRRPSSPAPLLAVVPGAFYTEHMDTGADGRRFFEMAAGLGYPIERIPLQSFGSLKENARILTGWLKQSAASDIILISLSKGGAEVKMALADPDASATFRRVRAWLNFSGILNGTRLIDWLLAHKIRSFLVWVYFLYRGYRFQVLHELRPGPGRPLDFQPCLPDHLKIVHIVGFPLTRDLSSPIAQRGFRRLSPHGPNDGGGIILSEIGQFPGFIYPVWGADHYLRPAGDMRSLFGKILNYVTEESV